MKKVNYPILDNYDFSDYRELTGDELYTINGGKEIENSIAAQANAQPGDTVTNSLGKTVTLTDADIKWAQEQCGMTGSTDTNSSPPAETENNPSSNANPSEPTYDYKPQLQVPDFEDPYRPKSDGTFEIDDENSIVSVEVRQDRPLNEKELDTLQKAYNAYYILEDRGYSFRVTNGKTVVNTFTNAKDAGKYVYSFDTSEGNLSEALGKISAATGISNIGIDIILRNSDDTMKYIKLSKYSSLLSKVSIITGIISLIGDGRKAKKNPTFKNISAVNSDLVGFIPDVGPFFSIGMNIASEKIRETAQDGVQLASRQLNINYSLRTFHTNQGPLASVVNNQRLDYLVKGACLQGLNYFFSEE